MNRNRGLAVGGLVLFCGAALYFALADSKADAVRPHPVRAATLPAQAAAPVAVDTAAALSPTLDASRPNDCLIEPSRVIRVNSGVEGVIEAIMVDRGDPVFKGQIVARLKGDVDRASAAAAQARASNDHSVRAAEARATYLDSVRRRTDGIRSHLARDKVEEAAANANAADEERSAAAQDQRVAQLEYLRSQRVLTEKTVRSPINGVVTERVMSVGEYRGPNATHILTLAQLNPLNVEVFAPIAQLGAVRVGDLIAIFPEQPVGGKYMARVSVIDRVFDAASGTFGMRLELPNPGNTLPAGLRCRIEISARPAARP